MPKATTPGPGARSRFEQQPAWSLYDDSIISEGYIRDAHARNVKVEPWAHEAVTMQNYIDHGVDGMITNHPDVLLELPGRDESELQKRSGPDSNP